MVVNEGQPEIDVTGEDVEVQPEVEEILELVFEALQDKVGPLYFTFILSDLSPIEHYRPLVRRQGSREDRRTSAKGFL